ncbi:MAG TPA: ferritin-like domain-containing protein [Gemmataceae bacterium]|nr:ferritin-like domain-containing protein [Gemmataceae bacterium]
MALFSFTEFNSFEDLFMDQLQDLYDAEQRLTKALPKMAQAAHNPQLKNAFEMHLRETENHVRRLERVFQMCGAQPKAKTCQAMKGLIDEGEEIISASGDPDVKDAGLIAAAQRVEHYEMAGYGTVRTFAQQLGHQDCARLLQETLDEEGAADKKLTQIAESTVNVHAATT